jgi:hypothetical protein
MDDTEKLLALQQELDQTGKSLGKLFPPEHPYFDDVFEELGEAGYYITEAVNRIRAALKTLQSKEQTQTERE